MKTDQEIKETKDKIISEFLAKTGTIQRPPCWICKHKVPTLIVDCDLKTSEVLITVSCHNDTESLRIPISKIPLISYLEMDWAFKDSSRVEGVRVKTMQ